MTAESRSAISVAARSSKNVARPRARLAHVQQLPVKYHGAWRHRFVRLRDSCSCPRRALMLPLQHERARLGKAGATAIVRSPRSSEHAGSVAAYFGLRLAAALSVLP